MAHELNDRLKLHDQFNRFGYDHNPRKWTANSDAASVDSASGFSVDTTSSETSEFSASNNPHKPFKVISGSSASSSSSGYTSRGERNRDFHNATLQQPLVHGINHFDEQWELESRYSAEYRYGHHMPEPSEAGSTRPHQYHVSQLRTTSQQPPHHDAQEGSTHDAQEGSTHNAQEGSTHDAQSQYSARFHLGQHLNHPNSDAGSIRNGQQYHKAPSEKGSIKGGQLSQNTPSDNQVDDVHYQVPSGLDAAEVAQLSKIYSPKEFSKILDEQLSVLQAASDHLSLASNPEEQWDIVDEDFDAEDTSSTSPASEKNDEQTNYDWKSSRFVSDTPYDGIYLDFSQKRLSRFKYKEFKDWVNQLYAAGKFPLQYHQLGLETRGASEKTVPELIRTQLKKAIDSNLENPKLKVEQVKQCLLMLSETRDQSCLRLHELALQKVNGYKASLDMDCEAFRRTLLQNLQSSPAGSERKTETHQGCFGKTVLDNHDQTHYLASLHPEHACAEMVLDLLNKSVGLNRVIKINGNPMTGEQLVACQGSRGVNLGHPNCKIDLGYLPEASTAAIQHYLEHSSYNDDRGWPHPGLPKKLQSCYDLEQLVLLFANNPEQFQEQFPNLDIQDVKEILEKLVEKINDEEFSTFCPQAKLDTAAYFNKIVICLKFLTETKIGLVLNETEQHGATDALSGSNTPYKYVHDRRQYSSAQRVRQQALEEGACDYEPDVMQSLQITSSIQAQNKLMEKLPLHIRVAQTEKERMVELFKRRDAKESSFHVRKNTGGLVQFSISEGATVAEFALRVLEQDPSFSLWNLIILFDGTDVNTPDLMSKKSFKGALKFHGTTVIHAIRSTKSEDELNGVLALTNPVTQRSYLPEHLQSSSQLEERAIIALNQIMKGRCDLPTSEFMEVRCGLKAILQRVENSTNKSGQHDKIVNYLKSLIACFEIFRLPFVGAQNSEFDEAIEDLAVRGYGVNPESDYKGYDADQLLRTLSTCVPPLTLIPKCPDIANECLTRLLLGAKFNHLTIQQLDRLEHCVHEKITPKLKEHISWIKNNLQKQSSRAQFEGMPPSRANQTVEREFESLRI
ncbi:hypothetical protein SOPP22_03595 [Shewanella sp. OPT22]|nr:hypothetical protein SOPP22_03595 [Shewanella sp. OPT22]